jgi:hypothetical protein
LTELLTASQDIRRDTGHPADILFKPVNIENVTLIGAFGHTNWGWK